MGIIRMPVDNLWTKVVAGKRESQVTLLLSNFFFKILKFYECTNNNQQLAGKCG